MTVLHEQAADLLYALWRGASVSLKSRYRMTIWRQFEDTIRASAYTGSLGRFISEACAKLQGSIGRTTGERTVAAAVLNSGEDRALLKLMREETAYLVLMVRVRAQEDRERWEAEHPKKE